MKYSGERTLLKIGNGVTIRESTTIHRGTVGGGGITEIGDRSLIMATVHVAHDCHLGQEVILSSFSVLAGHVRVEDWAIISGSSAAHQFVRIGRHSFVGGMTGAVKDIPPFMILAGVRDKAVVVSPNTVGMKRRNFSEKAIEAINSAFKLLHNHRPLPEVLSELESLWPDVPEIKTLCDFYRSSERGVYR
jgi:UDP-N-acetylglucosamine acyltransferase